MKVPRTPFRLNKPSSASPATVGGRAIGASTSGRINLVTFGFDLTSHHARGTPSTKEIAADKSEVHIESFTAVKDSPLVRLEKYVDHGTLMTRANIGREIMLIAR
jgi:hypothetical protein